MWKNKTNNRDHNRHLLDSLNVGKKPQDRSDTQKMGRLNALISFWIILTCNSIFFSKVYELTAYHGVKRALFMASTYLLLWAYLFILLTLITWGRRFSQVILTLVVLVSAQTAYFCKTYGVGIDPGQIQNMLETDTKEVSALMTPQMFLTVFGISIPAWFVIWRRQIRRTGKIRTVLGKLGNILGAILISLPLALMWYGTYAPMFRENRQLRDYITPQNFFSSLYRHYKKDRPAKNEPFQTYGTDAKLINNTGSTQPKLVVIMLGETARAESFGLNGYTRNTTPALAQQPIINYPNTSSCGTATAVSVPCMFSGMTRSDYEESVAKNREGLLDILQRAGYKVSWIDNNSGCKGTCDRIEKVDLPKAKYPELCKQDLCWDDILVNAAQDYLKSASVQNRVIVLHQAGSHGPAYYARYPASAKKFTPTCDTNEIQKCERQNLINTYDNTIVYTDQVNSRLIDLLKQDSRYQTAMIYVSDHGESTGEKGLYLHGAPYMFAPKEQTQVPMLYWFSDSYKKQQPQAATCINQNSKKAASHDNFFPTVLGLASVKTEVRNPSLDLTQCQNGS